MRPSLTITARSARREPAGSSRTAQWEAAMSLASWLCFRTRTAPVRSRRRHALHVESPEDRSLPSASLVADLVPGPESSNPASLINVNGALYFGAADPQNGKQALWKSDGTAAGTTLLKDIGSAPDAYFFTGGILYFS